MNNISAILIMLPDETSINILKCCGLWLPEKWTSGWKFRLYISYRAIVIFLVFSMPLFQFIEICTAVDYKPIYGNSTYIMTMIFTSVKIVIVVRYRKRIIKLLENLNTDDCQVKNSNEQTVQQHFHRLQRYRNKAYSLLLLATIFAINIVYLSRMSRRILPYRMWLPFNTTTNFGYGLKFADEYITVTISAVIAIGFDTFLFAIMIQICVQFGLLKCRIKSLDAMSIECPNETGLECSNVGLEMNIKNRIANYVRHHVLIHQLSTEMNSIFGPVMLCNYITSTVILCTTVYTMSRIRRLDVILVLLIVYIFLHLIEMYMLCSIGSELTVESASISQSIYDIKWYNWSGSNKKSMLIMMTRASRPVMFTSGKIFQISVESFVKLVHFAYSAYTCLKQTSK